MSVTTQTPTIQLQFQHDLPHQIVPLRNLLRLLHPQGATLPDLPLWGEVGFQTDVTLVRTIYKSVLGKETITRNGVDNIRDIVVNSHTQSLFHEDEGVEDAEATLLANLHAIQAEQNLELSKALVTDPFYRFSVEMETGTGKTYLFLRAIHELNKRYGYQKFIILHHLTAIKEGIKQSYQQLSPDFDRLFNQRDILIDYDAKNAKYIANEFANNDKLQVLLLGRDAINKDKNLWNTILDGQETTSMNKVACTRPIVFIDEPQNFSGEATKKSLAELNPLMVIDFSATHKESFPLLHSLSFYEAYDQGLVKKIALDYDASERSCQGFYVKVRDIKTSKKTDPKATLEINYRDQYGKPSRKEVTVEEGDSLYELTSTRSAPQYRLEDYCWRVARITKIEVTLVKEDVVDTQPVVIRCGNVHSVDSSNLKKDMIESTIRHHFDKQLQLQRLKMPLKVLSLFFIDEVKKYRSSNQGSEVGEYYEYFKNAYISLSQDPKYKSLPIYPVEKVHKGYFAQDKQGNYKDSDLKPTGELKETSEVKDTFELIMKDKARLLSLEEPLQFIFSHSAISEGWDNPNVFQLCFLKEHRSDRRAKQEIGRGLRLAVDGNGKRVLDNPTINTLTVVTDVSREEFIESFTANLKDDCPNRKISNLRDIELIAEKVARMFYTGEHIPSNAKIMSVELVSTLQTIGLVNDSGELITDDFENKKVDFNREIELNQAIPKVCKSHLIQATTNLFDPQIEFKEGGMNKPKSLEVQINEALLKTHPNNRPFKKLWKRIRQKVYYQLRFDTDDVLDEIEKQILEVLRYDKYQDVDTYKRKTVQIESVEQAKLQQTSNYHASTASQRYKRAEGIEVNRDHIVYTIADKTKFTDTTIARLLKNIASKREDLWLLFYHEPSIVDDIIELVNDSFKSQLSRDTTRVEYTKMKTSFYKAEMIHAELAKRRDNIPKELCVQLEHIENSLSNPVMLYQGFQPEKAFAERHSIDKDVLLFFKLPESFKIPTPVGPYNPDWAVVERVDNGEDELKYFVKETKSTETKMDKRQSEQSKIDCMKQLQDVCTNIEYIVEGNQ